MGAQDRTTYCQKTGGRAGWGALNVVSLALCACLGLDGLSWRSLAQVSVRGKNFVAPVTDAQGRKTVVRGEDARPIGPIGQGLLELTKMRAETYRGQEKDMLVEAANCLFDSRANVASSPGALSIHTADGRFSIEGKTFRWQVGDTRLSSRLVISNQVHSLVRKRLVNANPAGGAPAPFPKPVQPVRALPLGQTPPGSSTNEFIEITSEAFEYQADLAVYRGHVRAHEVEGDLICGVLTVFFQGESGAIERIEAEQDVVLTQGPTRVVADKAVYTIGQGNDVVQFTGHAVWTDGPRQGSGERVSYDRQQGIVRSEEKAYLKLPRTSLGESGLLSIGPNSPARPATSSTNSFVEVFSDTITIQLPPTNGPVRRLEAERSVLIVDPYQDGRALADKAIYEDATGILELTGSPMLQTERRLVMGKTIKINRNTRVLAAAPEAYLKLPVQGLGQLGMLTAASANLPASAAARTNQFIEVWSKEFEYHTNVLLFLGQVRANFLDGDVPRGKLTCDTSLTIRYGEHLDSLVSEKNVEVEQFALQADPQHVVRKVNCPVFRAEFSPEGRLKIAVAELGVTAEQEETRPGQPWPVRSSLSSETVTAFFSSLTNRVEKIVADKDVVFAQDQRIAHGALAVYTDTNGLVELTGHPTASMPGAKLPRRNA